MYYNNDIVAFGDSQSDYISGFGVQASDYWPQQLVRLLRSEKASVKARTFARSGFTSAQLLTFVGAAFQYSTPKIGIIYVGVNDATGSNSTATGTAQAGSTSNTIKLASSTTSQDYTYVGNIITITSGTGSGQSKTIIDYIGSTTTATVDSNWSTIPDATSVYSIAAPTQTQQIKNHQALIKSLKYKAFGKHPRLGKSVAVWYPSMLPSNGDIGQRYVVLNDNSSIAGAKNYASFHKTNIEGDYSSSPKVTVWEYRNKLGGISGWGRVAIDTTLAFEDGIDKIITISTNYLNYTTGGDNYNSATEVGTQYAANIPVRLAALTATQNESTVYCDLYDFQSKLINGGIFLGNTITSEATQGSNSWHYASSDQHHNIYGHDTVSRSVYYTIVNRNWINNLK